MKQKENRSFPLAFHRFLHLFPFFSCASLLSETLNLPAVIKEVEQIVWTHSHTQHKPKHGGALKVTKETDNTDCDTGLNTDTCIRFQIKSSVAKLLHRPRWRVRTGAHERENARKWEWIGETEKNERQVRKEMVTTWWQWVVGVVRGNLYVGSETRKQLLG